MTLHTTACIGKRGSAHGSVAAHASQEAKQTARRPGLMSAHAQGVWARAVAWAQEVGRSLWQVVRIRTFLVIVLQARSCVQLRLHKDDRNERLQSWRG